jgi:hypothetical protein
MHLIHGIVDPSKGNHFRLLQEYPTFEATFKFVQ